ncbi:M23 family metallopeptidase [Clostridium sp. MD294]|uniref:murein hydrolase activator EnvC family protein n=1 Tax=Clostridium sp. MD294 TaxID=97138 RepID=UPI0002C8DADB|nr:M23 family metallopeptidase [Clostridium sp. MD294]NDO47224.1 peptidoglycan DD-metalloendopeptidase family protein [Clostridium sp. MD294]USF29711.1 Murein hydrolase activator EnvC [Clostridium sp. MD294]
MKKRIKGIMSCMLVVCLLQPQYHVLGAKTINQLQQEKNQYQQNKKNAQDALQQTQQKQKTITEEISQLDKSATAAREELERVNTQLEQTQKNLEQAQKDLEEATQKKESQMATFRERVKFIHENGSVGYLKAIMQADSITDMISRAEYIHQIMDYDKNTLEELKRNQSIIEAKEKEITIERDEISVLVAQQKQKSDELEQKLAEKQKVSEQYRQDAQKYEEELKSWEQASAEVERLINEANKKAAEEAKRKAAAAAAAAQQSSRSNASASSSSGGGAAMGNVTYTGGQFAWPVPGRSYISSGYGYRNRPIGSGREFHTGYDIPGPTGTNIVAAAGGTVITAGYVNGFGYTVMINHGGGLVTLYGHNSKLLVSVGDQVSKGQAIAKCGSTGNSTGPHCHFEVRKNGKHTSPAPYLGV